MVQKCHFNPLRGFFIYFGVGLGGRGWGVFFSLPPEHSSALFRAAAICAVSFDTDGYFLRRGEGGREKKEFAASRGGRPAPSAIAYLLKSLHFKRA